MGFTACVVSLSTLLCFIAIFSIIAAIFYPTLWAWVVLGPFVGLGLYDYFQVTHSILRNFPVLGHFRYLFELIRPEIYQYFVESDTEGVPFGRDERSLVYQRAKNVRDTVPFGTKVDVYKTGYEWINHSMAPVHNVPEDMLSADWWARLHPTFLGQLVEYLRDELRITCKQERDPGT